MKNTILINDLNINQGDNVKINELINEYIKNNALLDSLNERQLNIIDKITNYGYDTIGLTKENVRFTIVGSKEKKKIDYATTMEGVENVDQFKKDKITRIWDDKKIEAELNVSYIVENTKPSVRINVLNKIEVGEDDGK